jgi:hypothetical protein
VKKRLKKLPGRILDAEQRDLQRWLAIVAGEVGFGCNPLQFAYRPSSFGCTALKLIGPGVA